MPKRMSYKRAGVDIDNADAAKRAMAESLKTKNPLVLNAFGAFASLLDGRFPEYAHPVLVCKTEEPGSKQLLAFRFHRIEGICFDLINHLINDIIVMGARPLFVQDLIICGKLESKTVKLIVDTMAKACRAQGCVLTGGETSEQPGVLAPGVYVLGASGMGVVEKSRILDGSTIEEGDRVIALASNGLHTNGYSLVRALMAKNPVITDAKIDGKPFLDVILRPHLCYYPVVKDLLGTAGLTGLAHITGGGIEGNLNRILPNTLDACIDASAIRVLPVFSFIKQQGNVTEADMRKTYNLGVGMIAVVKPDAQEEILRHIKAQDCAAYAIGRIVRGSGKVVMEGKLQWK